MPALLLEVDVPEALTRDVATVGRIEAIPSLLRLICQNTGMGFAAVVRITDDACVACAVLDDIEFGLKPGNCLDVSSTVCYQSRQLRAPIVIESLADDPIYRSHEAGRVYGIQSCVSVPIIRSNGSYFGNLFAADYRPAPPLADPRVLATLNGFSQLIAMQLDSEERREEAQAELVLERAAADLREHFVAVLGHDLRNPVSAVSAAAELLIRRPTEPYGASLGQRLLRVSRRMAALIDDVLDFAQARLGAGIALRTGQADDLATPLADVLDELRLANPGRTLLDTIDIGGHPVRCDIGRIQQLLSNLVGNALAHGAADRPISVRAAVLGQSVELSVVNFGQPIAAHDLDRLFEPYWRPADSEPGGGLGLGLYICAQIAKAHGGSMGVESSAENGTRFTAHLPILLTAAVAEGRAADDLQPLLQG